MPERQNCKRRFISVGPVVFALLFLFLSGCVSTSATQRWYNPATWFTDSHARKVEKLGIAEGKLQRDQIRHAALESYKTKAALSSSSFPPEKKIAVGARFAGNTFSLLNQVAPLGFAEIAEAEGTVAGLLTDLEEAKHSQAALEERYSRVGEQLAEVRVELAEQEGRARQEAAENAALANELKTERLIKYGSFIGNVLLLAGVFIYRNNLFGLTTGLANGLAKMQRKFGAEDEDVLALKSEIDSAISPSLQNKILNKVIRNA